MRESVRVSERERERNKKFKGRRQFFNDCKLHVSTYRNEFIVSSAHVREYLCISHMMIDDDDDDEMINEYNAKVDRREKGCV